VRVHVSFLYSKNRKPRFVAHAQKKRRTNRRFFKKFLDLLYSILRLVFLIQLFVFVIQINRAALNERIGDVAALHV
jgi:ABC-type methionine transport system permease subunit